MKIYALIFLGLSLCAVQSEGSQKAIQLTIPESSVATRTPPPITFVLDSRDTRKKRCTFYQDLETDDPDLRRIYTNEMIYYCDKTDQ